MRREKEIRDLIEVYTGIDVFSKDRKQTTVDARCLFDSILRHHRGYTYHAIADVYKLNGFKDANHTSARHRVKLFDEVVSRKKEYEELLYTITATSLSSRQISNLLQKVMEIKTQTQFKKINDYITKVLKE